MQIKEPVHQFGMRKNRQEKSSARKCLMGTIASVHGDSRTLTHRSNRAPNHQQPPVNFNGKTVAVVDDDPAVLGSTRILLEAFGASVLTYQRGADFLRQSPRSHCLVVDYHMPEMNGLALASELQRRADHTPAIMITALDEPTLRERAAKLGIRRVLHKSVGAGALLSEIQSLIGCSDLNG
jgi:two-component system response regulator FixJ